LTIAFIPLELCFYKPLYQTCSGDLTVKVLAVADEPCDAQRHDQHVVNKGGRSA